MGSRINETLLLKLFVKPEPLERKSHIFFNLHQRMFPCKDAFKRFLTTSDVSEQLVYAKLIIQRMCFESNFPPSFQLLLNLKVFEDGSANQSLSKNYIPQDHFSHIIYTYLLGLYFFFYCPIINKELTKEFIRKRNEADFDLALIATKDFISYWKYFCLFHDLAYPIERLCSPDCDLTNYDLYLNQYNQLYNCLAREILVEGATKYLIVWQILHDNENNLMFDNVLKPLKNFDFKQFGTEHVVTGSIISSLYGKYRVVDKIHCFEHFKMLTSFVNENDYVTVLFDALSEQPVALKSVADDRQTTYYFLQNQYVTIPESQMIQYLNHEDYLWDHNFYVRYFFADLDSKKEFMRLDYAGGFFSKDDYQIILKGIEQNFEASDRMRFSKINTSNDLSAYLFQCYQTLLSYISEIIPPTDSFPTHSTNMKANNNGRKVQKYLDEYFKNYFKNVVLEQLPFSDFKAAEESLDELEKSNIESDKVLAVINKAVEDLFDIRKIEQYKQNIVQQFSGELSNALYEEKRWNGLVVEFLFQCNKGLFPTNSFNNLTFIDCNKGIDYEMILSLLRKDQHTKKSLYKIESYFKERKISLDDLIKSYHTDFLSFDHGICGSLIFLLSWHFYSDVIDKLFESTGDDNIANIMSTLCWNIESPRYKNKLRDNYDYITYAVFRSVLCHNLYPDEIKKSLDQSLNWSYNFFEEASNYFGMMVDALQVWNREKYYKYSDVNWQPLFTSDEYDIEIRNNVIVLKIQSHNSGIKQIANKFIFEKESYLQSFSSFLAIEVASDISN